MIKLFLELLSKMPPKSRARAGSRTQQMLEMDRERLADWDQAMRYSYRVRWSEQDEEHIAVCDEFPGLSFFEEDPVHALTGLIELVFYTLRDMRVTGETPPKRAGTPKQDPEQGDLLRPAS